MQYLRRIKKKNKVILFKECSSMSQISNWFLESTIHPNTVGKTVNS